MNNLVGISYDVSVFRCNNKIVNKHFTPIQAPTRSSGAMICPRGRGCYYDEKAKIISGDPRNLISIPIFDSTECYSRRDDIFTMANVKFGKS